ncbi:Uncharacterised protein [uncultured archaeon]|nr:Uncharacterised protein [uncultured archaeon]
MMEFAIISIIGIVASLAIAFVLNKLGISARLKEIQTLTNKVNKDYFDALKKKDMKRLDELDIKMKESQQMSMETIMLQFKSMAVTLPVAFGLPYLLQHFLFPAFIITLPFQIPIPFRPDFFSLTWRDTFGAYGWFWLSFIFLGGFAQVVKGQLQKKPAAKTDGKDQKK